MRFYSGDSHHAAASSTDLIHRRTFLLLSSAAFARLARADNTLDLTVTLADVSYCKLDTEIGSVQLRLECAVLNKGSAAVYVALSPDPPHAVFVARSIKDVEDRVFLHKYWTTTVTSSLSDHPNGPRVNLKPGAIHRWSTTVDIWTSVPVGREKYIKPGSYVLSVMLDPWHSSSGKGRLALEARVPFVIDENPAFTKCWP